MLIIRSSDIVRCRATYNGTEEERYVQRYQSLKCCAQPITTAFELCTQFAYNKMLGALKNARLIPVSCIYITSHSLQACNLPSPDSVLSCYDIRTSCTATRATQINGASLLTDKVVSGARMVLWSTWYWLVRLEEDRESATFVRFTAVEYHLSPTVGTVRAVNIVRPFHLDNIIRHRLIRLLTWDWSYDKHMWRCDV